MSQRIVVDLQKITDLNCGLGQFSWHLAKELFVLDEEINYYLPRSSWSQLEGVAEKHLIDQQKWHRHFRWFGPKADIFHILHQEGPYLPSNKNARIVLTLHDLNILLDEDKSEAKQQAWLKAVQARVDRASAVVFISKYAQQIANEKLKFSADQMQRVIYNGVPVREIAGVSPKMNMAKPFFVAVATVLKKKNFHVLIEMMERLPDYGFVLAGWKDNPYAAKMEEEIRKRKLDDRFLLIGKVSESEKNWLYQNCSGLVFPSLQEGFGLPVVEAMHFGAPVFLSKHCALPEIGGEVAFYFDHFEADHMAEVVLAGIKKFAEDRNLKQRLMSRGRSFSWSAAAQNYLDLYYSL